MQRLRSDISRSDDVVINGMSTAEMQIGAMISRLKHFFHRQRPLEWLLVSVLAAFVWLFLCLPAINSHEQIERLRHDEQTGQCEPQAYHRVSSAAAEGAFTRSQEHAKSPGGDRQEPTEDSNTCAARQQAAIASRANLIAIESLENGAASAFIAYLATVVSIVALLTALRQGAGSAHAICLIPNFIPGVAAGDDGILTISNRSEFPVLLDVVVVNGSEELRQASTHGLYDLPAGATIDFPVILRATGLGSIFRMNFLDHDGRRCALWGKFGRISGGWALMDLRNH